MRHVLLSLVCLAVASAVIAQGKTEPLNGYAEWRQGTEIIVDGQRVTFTASTKFTGWVRRRTSQHPARLRSQGDGHPKTRRLR